MESILMIVMMIAVFYFLLIRPENKRKKEADLMRSNLKKGDWLTTIGGVYGRVVSVNDRTVVIETGEDRVRIEFVKNAVGVVGTLDEQEEAAQRPSRRRRAADDAATAQELMADEPAAPAEAEQTAETEESAD